MTPVLGVIADDLTGGMELASMLVAQGVACDFVTDPGLISPERECAAIVLAQKTRVAPVAEAVEKSIAGARAMLAAGVRQIFFKYCATFDSTDDGNIGPVAERLLELTSAPLTGYCPSSPEFGRSVFNGHLFVGSQLVSDSPKRFDPLTPMTDPRLVEVLARQCQWEVGSIPHAVVRSGGATLETFVQRQREAGLRHLIVDAIYDEDLNNIAELTVNWRLMTGNSAIAQKYPAIWRRLGWLGAAEDRPLEAVPGDAVVLAGSCADRTLEQLNHFEQSRPVLRIDLLAETSRREHVEKAVSWAGAHLREGPVAIATSASPPTVRLAQEKFGREGAARLAENILCDIAEALKAKGATRFLIAGGETSGGVVERLGVSRLRVGGYAGSGVALAVTDEQKPIAFCLKSGKLGRVDMFLPTLEAMRERR